MQHSRSPTFVYYAHAAKLICTCIQNYVRAFRTENALFYDHTMLPTKKSHGDSPNLVSACMHSRMTALLASEVLASHGDVRLECLCTEKSVLF